MDIADDNTSPSLDSESTLPSPHEEHQLKPTPPAAPRPSIPPDLSGSSVPLALSWSSVAHLAWPSRSSSSPWLVGSPSPPWAPPTPALPLSVAPLELSGLPPPWLIPPLVPPWVAFMGPAAWVPPGSSCSKSSMSLFWLFPLSDPPGFYCFIHGSSFRCLHPGLCSSFSSRGSIIRLNIHLDCQPAILPALYNPRSPSHNLSFFLLLFLLLLLLLSLIFFYYICFMLHLGSGCFFTRRFLGIRRPGNLARQLLHMCGSHPDHGSSSLRLWRCGIPSTLPSWTYEDTSMH